MEHVVWAFLATLCYASLVVGAGVGVIWFTINNFLVAEVYHPLDYFSNKLRSRPHVFLLAALGLALCAALPSVLGISAALLAALPDLAAVVYGLGLVIFVKVWTQESTAAGLLALLLYAPVSFATVLIVMSPVLTENWAGWLYCNLYLVAHLVWVLWLRTAANRRMTGEKITLMSPAWRRRLCCCCQRCAREPDEPLEPTSLLPEGSEKLTRLWERAVHFAAPLLLVFSNVVNLLIHLVKERELGWTFAVSYWLLACALLAGCSYDYRAGTEVE
mmetsp:Transcript_99369/g.259093  ORF Transcript_99369/g.259093 Transcript_99369/m.259093 type:complete len:274 (-) Transcript_99369:179-1000(-)